MIYIDKKAMNYIFLQLK